MPTLEERYFNYDKYLRGYNAETEKQKKSAAEEKKIKQEYPRAFMNLKEYARNSCRIIGYNLYIINEHGVLAPICKQDFSDALNEAEKNRCYSIIRSGMKMSYDNIPYNDETFRDNKRMKNALATLRTSYGNSAETAFRFLYELSNGNFKTLGIFLNLCAEIAVGVNSSSKPTVILAEKELHQKLIDFFAMFSDHAVSSVDFDKLTKIRGLHRLSVEAFLGSRVNVVINSKIPETELAVKKLSKLMSGKKISVKNPSFSGNLHFINKMPFVYITESHLQYRKMKTIYGAADFKILSKNLDRINFDKAAAAYIRYSITDLKQMLDENKRELARISRKVTNDDIFKEFVKNRCCIKDNAVCEKAALYEAYVKYYKSHFGEQPLTKIIFGKKFALFGSFETVRPHSSRKHYPYCFKGIELDKEKIEKAECKEASRYSTAYEKFENKLIEMLS